MQLTGRVVHDEDKFFYIQVHISPSPDGYGGPKDLKKLQIQTCEKNPAPRSSEPQLGQLVAGCFHGKWYRALIEEIDFNCEDLVIFFVDYVNPKIHDRSIDSAAGRRDVGFTGPSRPLLSDGFKEVHFSQRNGNHQHPGGVGRSDGQEYTLWVTVCPSPVDENIISTNTPPKEPVDPFTAYTPMKLHKAVRTLSTPPAPEAIGAKRNRFPDQRLGHSGTSDVPYGSDHHHCPNPVPPIPSSAKSAFRASLVPSQSPVYVPPPPALYEGQENRFRTKTDKVQETYTNLTQQLDVHFANSSLLLEQLNQANTKTIGLICAANVDGHWNRCRIVDMVDDKTMTLYLTDVGKKTKHYDKSTTDLSYQQQQQQQQQEATQQLQHQQLLQMLKIQQQQAQEQAQLQQHAVQDFNVQQQQHSQPPRSLPQQQHVNEQLKQLLAEREFLREHSNVNSGGGEPPVVPSIYGLIGSAGTAEARPTASSNARCFMSGWPAALDSQMRGSMRHALESVQRGRHSRGRSGTRYEWRRSGTRSEWRRSGTRSNSASGITDSLTSSIVSISSESSSHTPFQQSPVSDWNLDHVGNNWLRSIDNKNMKRNL
ncbi:hypothetical protein DAPPUDRAFT_251504 [Daphnia pulex]|uniref:Tudor domain-containing protein n=1 Tax=Daphnia pulex TaxID=6669 RepID=E9H0K1_DAPPU|nr:hypothetical protein DAPPUDRAFT_251504 [Daphnia pulex]|eukprot:EFX74662.1 hypothetical protein DAPPUDRAFT_251504 [Daphnia pulex]